MSPPKETPPVSGHPHPLPSPQKPLTRLPAVDLPVLDVSCKWTHRLCGPLYLASSICHPRSICLQPVRRNRGPWELRDHGFPCPKGGPRVGHTRGVPCSLAGSAQQLGHWTSPPRTGPPLPRHDAGREAAPWVTSRGRRIPDNPQKPRVGVRKLLGFQRCPHQARGERMSRSQPGDHGRELGAEAL